MVGRVVDLLAAGAFDWRAPGFDAMAADVVPGSDPDRAADLLGPVAALRQAVVYRLFLDHIEPAEQIYHYADPALWLRRAASAVTTGVRW